MYYTSEDQIIDDMVYIKNRLKKKFPDKYAVIADDGFPKMTDSLEDSCAHGEKCKETIACESGGRHEMRFARQRYSGYTIRRY